MAPRKKPTGVWKRPLTVVYGDNYDYGFNSYGDVMHWLDGKDRGLEKPAPKIPTLNELADQHFRFRYGRPLIADLAEDPDVVSHRLEDIKRASEAVDRKHELGQLRRSRTLGAFAARAANEIAEDIRLEAAASLDDHLERRRWNSDGPRSVPQYEPEHHNRYLAERRRRLADSAVDEHSMHDDQHHHSIRHSEEEHGRVNRHAKVVLNEIAEQDRRNRHETNMHHLMEEISEQERRNRLLQSAQHVLKDIADHERKARPNAKQMAAEVDRVDRRTIDAITERMSDVSITKLREEGSSAADRLGERRWLRYRPPPKPAARPTSLYSDPGRLRSPVSLYNKYKHY
jgi:hypothetical protein